MHGVALQSHCGHFLPSKGSSPMYLTNTCHDQLLSCTHDLPNTAHYTHWMQMSTWQQHWNARCVGYMHTLK